MRFTITLLVVFVTAVLAGYSTIAPGGITTRRTTEMEHERNLKRIASFIDDLVDLVYQNKPITIKRTIQINSTAQDDPEYTPIQSSEEAVAEIRKLSDARFAFAPYFVTYRFPNIKTDFKVYLTANKRNGEMVDWLWYIKYDSESNTPYAVYYMARGVSYLMNS